MLTFTPEIVYADGFTAQAIESIEPILNYESAMGGSILDPSYPAELCLNLKPKGADVMAYCFRRFGYPAVGWDDFKDLAKWIVTTPMPEVYLLIKPSDGNCFGYCVSRNIINALVENQNELHIKRDQAFRAWALKEKQITILDNFNFWGSSISVEEMEPVYDAWLNADPSRVFPESEDERYQLFFNEKSLEAEQLETEFVQLYPEHTIENVIKNTPKYHYGLEDLKQFRANPLQPLERFWLTWPPESIVYRVNQAIYRTLQDLFRPVYIRDVKIDIAGTNIQAEFVKYDENDNPIFDYMVPFSDHAGVGLPNDFFINQAWKEIYKLIAEKCPSIAEGTEKIIYFLTPAPPPSLPHRPACLSGSLSNRQENFMNLGRVWSDNIEDPNNEASIKSGWVDGEGHLGAIQAAGYAFAAAAREFYYDICEAELEQARLDFFRALKALELEFNPPEKQPIKKEQK
jgi:hypothetical protein